MSAYLMVIRGHNGKALDMGIWSAEALTLGIHMRAERVPKPYAAITGCGFDDARALILARMLTDKEPWPDELQPFADSMLAEWRARDPYREPAPDPAPDPAEVITETAWLYMAEFVYERPDDLPAPHNRIRSVRIVEHRSERSGQRQSLHDEPSLLSWSTRERIDDMRLINWILERWAQLADGRDGWPHCRSIEIRRER